MVENSMVGRNEQTGICQAAFGLPVASAAKLQGARREWQMSELEIVLTDGDAIEIGERRKPLRL